jgi:hypothetical protein
MTRQSLIDNRNDLIQNIRTFNRYKDGSDEKQNLYEGKLKNHTYFFVMEVDRRHTFTPARFGIYKNNNKSDYESKNRIGHE